MTKKSQGKNSFYTKYKSNILDMACYLKGNHDVRTHCRGLGSSFDDVYRSLQGVRNNKLNLVIPPFEFEAKDKDKDSIDLGKSKTSISIGGYIRVEEREMAQSISVCVNLDPIVDVACCDQSYFHPEMSSSKKYIIRRFHFDIDSKNGDKPTSHIQYGGKIHDSQRKGYEYSLFSSLDHPRIPIQPTDLVQVIHLFFSQFKSSLAGVILKPQWKKILSENDKIWFEYYHQELFNGLKKSNPENFYTLSKQLPRLWH